MRLGEIAGLLLKDALPEVRRWVIGIAIAAIAVAAALIELTSAARHALEPLAGPVWSRVIVASAFLAVAAAALLTPYYARRRNAARAEATPPDEALKQRFAILAEAVGVGFSLGRDFRKAAAPNGKDHTAPEPAAPPSDNADAEKAP
jgi:hypothetical protein